MTDRSPTWSRPLHALLYALLACVLGCTGTDSRIEPTLAEQQVLAFPVTVTLSTPTGVSPIAPTMLGSDLVQLGARAEVVSGTAISMGTTGLDAEPDALLNDTWSRGPAVLKDRVHVRGTLHARTLTPGNSVVITTRDATPAFDPASVLAWKVNYPAGTASNVTLNAQQSQPLAPGKYGTVSLNSPSTLTLTTGTYYLTALNVQSSSVVRLDQKHGPIVIYVTDGVVLRGSFVPVAGTAPPDLLIVYLGTAPIFVESLFSGAIIAPFAQMTLRSVTGVHSGYFAAKQSILDAGARVTYRAPLAVVGAANPPGDRCRQLISGQVADADLFLYCHSCLDGSDTDRDGVEDCVDGCPDDVTKTSPGVCGCGLPETDTDNDGAPDCWDSCKIDPNNVTAGQCGCVREAGVLSDLQPAGTPCTDPACPQTNATCNGAGVCGNRSACLPAPGCRFINNNGISYWFCPGPLTESAASQACTAKQMQLARVNSLMEDRFIQRYVTAPTWVGANSITTSGVWRWATPTTNNGDQFWQGGATGSQKNSFFSFWKQGAPASQRCAVIQPEDGRWVDVDCTQALGFVCESPPPTLPRQPTQPPPGGNGQPAPPTKPCVPLADSGLPSATPAGSAQLRADVDASYQNIFDGSAKNPPPDGSNTCTNDASSQALGDFDSGAGCRLNLVTNATDSECVTDQDCAHLGSGLVCRMIQDDPNCVPDASHPNDTVRDAACVGHARCGTLQCPPIQTPTRCDQVEVCGPPTVDAGVDTSNLTPTTFDPTNLFGGATPPVTSVGSYHDLPTGTGKNHSWCFMNNEQPLPQATQPDSNKHGTGGSTDISFRFDPDLTFDANVNPLSLGETDLEVHARAQLVAGIKVQNLFGSGVGFDKDILRAVADIHGQRCTLKDTDSAFEVFGLNFIPPDNPYIFDTSKGKIQFLPGQPDISGLTKDCNEAVGDFITAVNRAKKAFRDAQTLLSQYYDAKATGQNLGKLCEDVLNLVGGGGTLDLPGFPGGLNCSFNEPVETTLQRFIDYYQAPGGSIAELKAAIDKLVKATDEIQKKLSLNQRVSIVDVGKSESQTLVNIPFAIGPVPMQLEIDAYYSYGVAGYFEYSIQFPFNPLKDKAGDSKEIAGVKAGVMPHANAGISAFVGAGGGLGPFSATLGVEGALSLADLKVPIFAGAGIGATITEDARPFENKLGPPVSLIGGATGLEPLTHFDVPKAFKFYVYYDYGAAVDIQKILQGSLNATLRIQFFLFSRTWRQQIASFNGFQFHQDLVSGKAGTNTDPRVSTEDESIPGQDPAATTVHKVVGATDVGLSEPQTPLAVLIPPPAPVLDPDPTQVKPFDPTGNIERPFYDNECCSRPDDPEPQDESTDTCTQPGEHAVPGGPVPCCPGFVCINDLRPDVGARCFPAPTTCKGTEGACTGNGDCCSGLVCFSDGTCEACGNDSTPCQNDNDCCSGETCGPQNGPPGVCWRCRVTGEVCTSDQDCCGVSGVGGIGFGCGDPDPSGVRTCGPFVN
jgi:hypothetical protein